MSKEAPSRSLPRASARGGRHRSLNASDEERMAGRAREPLTVPRVVQAALAIIDAEGTQAVTMRRVADALGVRAPSLYEHVANRDELLDLAADEVTREIGDPMITGDWQRDVRAHFMRTHEVLEAHGDVAFLHFGSVPARPEQAAGMERLLASLVERGVDPVVASIGLERLSIYTIADVYEGWEFWRRSGAATEEEATKGIRAHFKALSDAEFPMTRRFSQVLSDAGGQGLFEAGLDLIIAGMAAMAGGSGPTLGSVKD